MNCLCYQPATNTNTTGTSSGCDCGSLGCEFFGATCDPVQCTCVFGGTTTGTGGTYDTCASCNDFQPDCANAGEVCIVEDPTSSNGYCSPVCLSDFDCEGSDVCTVFQNSAGQTYQGCYPESGTCTQAGSTGTTGTLPWGAICTTCTQDSDCNSGSCDLNWANPGFCNITTTCVDASQCSGYDCWSDTECNCPNSGVPASTNSSTTTSTSGTSSAGSTGSTGSSGATGSTGGSTGSSGGLQPICGTCSSSADCASNYCNRSDASHRFCDSPDPCSSAPSECSPASCNVTTDSCTCP